MDGMCGFGFVLEQKKDDCFWVREIYQAERSATQRILERLMGGKTLKTPQKYGWTQNNFQKHRKCIPNGLVLFQPIRAFVQKTIREIAFFCSSHFSGTTFESYPVISQRLKISSSNSAQDFGHHAFN